jgi:hypothetical protein
MNIFGYKTLSFGDKTNTTGTAAVGITQAQGVGITSQKAYDAAVVAQQNYASSLVGQRQGQLGTVTTSNNYPPPKIFIEIEKTSNGYVVSIGNKKRVCGSEDILIDQISVLLAEVNLAK